MKPITPIASHEKKVVLLLLFSIGCFMSYLAYYNQFWEGGAENFWHYFFSRYAYEHPEFFLNHWAKPLFVLLSAPFAQFGFYGLNLFNILCGLFSAYIVYLFCVKLNLRNSWFSVLLVLFTPMYFLMLQSAMTEILFALVMVLASYLLYSEKYAMGSIMASCLLYCRSEGMFIVMIFAVFLLLEKRWKYLPLLATAMVIYSFAGLFSGHNFFWYFTENPYAADSPYGHGDYMHFIDKYEYTLGLPHVVLLGIGTCILLFTIVKTKGYLFYKHITTDVKVLLLVLAPAVAFSAFHMYAWAEGKFGSAGIERVFACVIPLTAIVGMYAVDKIEKIKIELVQGLALSAIFYLLVVATFKHRDFPVQAHNAEKTYVEVAADWFKKERKEGYVMYYGHPGILFYCDYNPFDSMNRECQSFPNDCSGKKGEKYYYLWDSAFSKFACGTSLEDVERCPDLKKIKEYRENDYTLVFFESK